MHIDARSDHAHAARLGCMPMHRRVSHMTDCEIGGGAEGAESAAPPMADAHPSAEPRGARVGHALLW